MLWRRRYACGLAVIAASVAGCGGGSKRTTIATRPDTASTPVAISANTTALPISANGPTACTVYDSGYATQVVFASQRFDVRAECRAWTRNGTNEGYLWGYQPAGSGAEPANSREICFLEDSRGSVAVRVIAVSGFRAVTRAQRAHGSSACTSLMSFGWIQQASAPRRHPARN